MNKTLRASGIPAILAWIAVFCLAEVSWAQSGEEIVNGHRARAGEVIVRYRVTPSTDKLANTALQVDASSQKRITHREHWRVKSRSRDVLTLMSDFAGDPDVDLVEPNYVITVDAVPSDTGFANQWGLRNTGQAVNGGSVGTPGADIGVASAWEISTGSRSVVVAVLDSGVNYTHTDLGANIWSAPASFTVSIGGLDLTCPAGTRGFNAIAFTCDPADDFSHGTHVAGIVGAVGNNSAGVSGVSQFVTMMPLKILDSKGVGSVADAIEAIEFAIQVKAAFAATSGANIRILNSSWGGNSYSQALSDEIAKAGANEMLFVASAGNSGANTDMTPYYPSGYALSNVISVGATDGMDLPPLFTNYGTGSVHLSAPGVNIYSTIPASAYGYKTGTSQSTAFVSGAAALVLGKCTTLTTAGLRSNLLNNVSVLAGLAGMNQTSGRLNVNSAIRACGAPPPTPTGLAATGVNTAVSLTWSPVAGATSYTVKWATKSTGTYTIVASGITSPTHVKTGLVNGTSYYFKVAAANASGTSADSAYVLGKPVAPVAPTGLVATAGISQVQLKWTAAAGAASYVVKKATSATGTYTAVASGVKTTGYTVTGLTNGTAYYFKVATETPYGNSPDSASVTAKPVACPTPTGLVAAGGVAQVSLTWTATPGATSYVVKKATSATGTYTTVASGLTATGYTGTGLTNGTAAYFKVAAANASGTSADSAYVTATPRALPTAPPSPTATAGTGKITLAWSAATGATGYRIYRSTTPGGPYELIATTTSRSYINSPLVKGTKYYYVIKAYNANNQEGPASLEVSATVL